MQRIQVLSENPSHIECLKKAFFSFATFHLVSTREALSHALATDPPSLLLLDIDWPEDTILHSVRQLRVEYPCLPIVLYVKMSTAMHAQAILEFGHAGVMGILLRDMEDTEERMRQIFEYTFVHKVDLVRDMIVKNISSLYIKRFVQKSFSVTEPRVKVSALCDALHFSRQHLARECKAAELPHPEWLSNLPRMLRLAWFIDQGITNNYQLAIKCDFSSSSAMIRHMKVHFGLTPQTLRANGGFNYLVSIVEQKFVSSKGVRI